MKKKYLSIIATATPLRDDFDPDDHVYRFWDDELDIIHEATFPEIFKESVEVTRVKLKKYAQDNNLRDKE